MSAPMIPFSLDSRRTRERSRRLLSKHFYAITGIRDWILSKRLQLQEITRVSPYAIRATPPSLERWNRTKRIEIRDSFNEFSSKNM